ncbi:MAG: flippase-like domain-containing protein [Bdellovibrionales bacterium]
MLRIAAILGLLGLAAATGVIIWSGYDQVLGALRQAGWGIVLASLFHLVPMLCCVIGWRGLMPGRKRPSLGYFFYILWLRASVNNLMPVARIGGEIVSVRVMVRQGVRQSLAIASTVVELTTSVAAVFVFVVLGVALFSLRISDTDLGMKLASGVLISIPMIAAMVAVQKFGFFGMLDKIFTLMVRDRWKNFSGSAARLDRAVRLMYKRRARVLACFFWQFMSWVTGTFEVWLALYFLGHPLGLAECFMIESLIQASTSAAFMVPGALGVQEAGFLVFGRMLGLSPEIATALAVIRRCRDLLLYVPGLIAWQIQEGKWMLSKAKK